MDHGASPLIRHTRGAADQLSWPARSMLVAEPLAGLVIGLLLVCGFAAHRIGALAGLSWRLSCLGYAAVCLMRGVDWRQARSLSMVWFPFLGCAALAGAVLHSPASVADLVRQLFIFGWFGIVFGAAHDRAARRIGFWALSAAVGAILVYALIQTLPTLSSGWSYAAARTLKGKSFQSGFNANEVCFAALFALIAGYPEAIAPRWVCLGIIALTGACSVLLGARAPPLALLLGAGAGCMMVRAPIWAACARHRALGGVVTALVTGGSLALFFGHIADIAHSTTAVALAGRAALWQIALAAWPQQPLFGFGPGTFQDVIHANLGKAHFSTPDEFGSLYALQSGGFHNIWLSVLVERGAIGLAGMFASWCLLVNFALRHGGGLTPARRFVLATLLAGLFLRGQVELAGLFDDADGPISEIVMMVIALILPRPAPVGRGVSVAAFAVAAQSRDLAAAAAAQNYPQKPRFP